MACSLCMGHSACTAEDGLKSRHGVYVLVVTHYLIVAGRLSTLLQLIITIFYLLAILK